MGFHYCVYEEYYIWIGHLGSNQKGTIRKLLDEYLGTYTGGNSRGYGAVLDPTLLCSTRTGEAPSELMSNLRGSRVAFADDFSADARHPLSSALMRRITGGNKLTAARENRGNLDYDTVFGVNLLVNEVPEFEPPLAGADLRRCTVVNFKLSYRDETKYDAANPLHRRKKASVKRDIFHFFPEFTTWIRGLAGSVRHIDASRLMPQPLSVQAHSAELEDKMACDVQKQVIKEFVDGLVVVQGIPTCSAAQVRNALQAKHPGLTKSQIVELLAAHGLVETSVKRGGKPYRVYTSAGRVRCLPQ